MGSTSIPPAIPPLTAFERIGPKGWIRYVFLFQLAEEYKIGQVVEIVRHDFDEVKDRFPEADCEAVPDIESRQQGVFKLQKLRSGEIESVVVKDLRHPDKFSWTYDELKAQSFPVSAFDANLLCRGSVWAAPGERMPISLSQANFIRGGLILTWNIFHMVGDGTSFCTWMKVWAEGCRRAQALDIPDPIQLHPDIWNDREQLMKPSGKNHGRLEDHPEYTLLPFTPTGAPPKMLSPHHRGQVFRFSPESLKALKADASPANASEPSDQEWISTNDAVSALIWRTVMAVQSPMELLEGDPVSNFGISINGRQRMSPKIHPDTSGCFLGFVPVIAPVRDIVSHSSLADLAILIRKAVLRADDQFGDDVVTLVDSVDDVSKLVPTAFLDIPGFNCVLSSWTAFSLYSLDWGPILGKHIDAVRTPSVGLINGGQFILPVLPDGGMEVLMGVDESCLDRLRSDSLLNKYAIAV
ncbi:unnamed protein product [Penicillium salamii]|uniref:Trichothecene 3-O-acetyltransferase-like N-terminal domain-containing protein n=1 Tax=Penicillium salamii TaxID=1612424 RepID=A0A9W4IA73_9EURO|nr:unnamed protein product [Penicillium salamii]CAG7965221.1 unnamed protein product [Penicillium salamii]CAG7986365.1 unnamed protein product [Penicillium salamii]CAG8134452.1 unnamed protein product [Penicillium salamii]CAG8191283.1 unnamed protein product [Penicillium salamii]